MKAALRFSTETLPKEFQPPRKMKEQNDEPNLIFQLLPARHRSPRKQQKSVLTLHWASSASKKNEETK